jgi:hypothetical protein
MDAAPHEAKPETPRRREINLANLSADQLHSDMARPALDLRYKNGEKLLVSPEMNMDLLDLPGINLAPVRKANKFDNEWAENTDALVRMKSLGRQRRKSALMEFDLSDPLAFVKGDRNSDDDYDLRNDVCKVVRENKSDCAVSMFEMA